MEIVVAGFGYRSMPFARHIGSIATHPTNVGVSNIGYPNCSILPTFVDLDVVAEKDLDAVVLGGALVGAAVAGDVCSLGVALLLHGSADSFRFRKHAADRDGHDDDDDEDEQEGCCSSGCLLRLAQLT